MTRTKCQVGRLSISITPAHAFGIAWHVQTRRLSTQRRPDFDVDLYDADSLISNRFCSSCTRSVWLGRGEEFGTVFMLS